MEYLLYWFLNLWPDSLIPATKPISIVNLQFLKLLDDYPKNLISFQEHTLNTSTSYQSHIFQTLTSWSTPNNICYDIYFTVDWFFHKLQFLDLKSIHLYLDSFCEPRTLLHKNTKLWYALPSYKAMSDSLLNHEDISHSSFEIHLRHFE